MTKLDIKSVETLGTFENIVSASPKEIQDVARALRGLIADVYPGVTEVPWGVQKNIGYGIGPRKQSEHFCYIFPHAHHVKKGRRGAQGLPRSPLRSAALPYGADCRARLVVQPLDVRQAPGDPRHRVRPDLRGPLRVDGVEGRVDDPHIEGEVGHVEELSVQEEAGGEE